MTRLKSKSKLNTSLDLKNLTNTTIVMPRSGPLWLSFDKKNVPIPHCNIVMNDLNTTIGIVYKYIP